MARDFYDEVMRSEKFRDAREHFKRACWASRIHLKEWDQALEKYGDHGREVPIIGRDHFPEKVKASLRELSEMIARELSAAYAARPKRVRQTTMCEMERIIAHEEGTGGKGLRIRDYF